MFADASRGRGFVDGLDPDVFSTSPDMVAVTFDARPYLERKLSALTAHQSAFGVTSDTLRNPPPAAAHMLRAFQPVLEREVFVLGGTCRRNARRRSARHDRFGSRAPRGTAQSTRDVPAMRVP